MYRHSEVISKIAVSQHKRQLQRVSPTAPFFHFSLSSSELFEVVLRVMLPGPSF